MLRHSPALTLLVLVAACAAPAAPTPAPPTTEPAQANVDRGTWRPLHPGPVAERYDAAAFWTGSEVLVLGGTDAPPCPPNADCEPPAKPPFRGGAAVDPIDGGWRVLADAPVALGPMRGVVVDGSVYILDGGNEPTFLAYRIADDRWVELPPPPTNDRLLDLVVAGSRIVAYRTSQESGPGPDLVFDPATSTWTDLPADPLGPAYDRSIVWTGRDLVLLGIRLDRARPGNVPPLFEAAALDPGTGAWRALPPSEVVGGHSGWFWVGGSLVGPGWGGADGGEVNNWGRVFPFGGMLTPPAAAWEPLPPRPPGPAGARPPPDAAGRATVAGAEHVTSGDGWILDVPARTWTQLAPLPERVDGGVAAVWAGADLFVFGGVRWDGAEATILNRAWVWRP